MNALRALAGERKTLLVADSKLVSWPNVTALVAAEAEFIAPLPAARVPAGFYAGLDLQEAAEVRYTPVRAETRPNADPDRYRVLEDEYELAGPRKRDTPVRVRRILVHSSGNATGQAKARAKRLAKAGADLDKLAAGAGGRYYGTDTKIAARIGVIAKSRRFASVLRTEITTDHATGKPALAWSWDEHALAAEAAADGWYSLITPPPGSCWNTRAKARSNAATATSKARWPSHRCSCRKTTASQPSSRSSASHCSCSA
jgi:hypothetical protein